MPNLQLSRVLREKYGVKQQGLLKEAFDLSRVDPKSEIYQAFRDRRQCNVALAFIDISGFSDLTRKLSTPAIVQLLERFYDLVIPRLYHHGGEVEKIIGDGIIAVFGEPFIARGSDFLAQADTACKEVIRALHGSRTEVKCALHEGSIFYLQTGTEDYQDYTMIGGAITELFRLESVGVTNSIAFYTGTRYEVAKEKEQTYELVDFLTQDPPSPLPPWLLGDPVNKDLQGLGTKAVRYLYYQK